MIKQLNDGELQSISGGAIKSTILAIFAGIGVFIVGFCDGLFRQLKSAKRK